MTLAVSQAEAFNVYTLTKAAFLPQMTRTQEPDHLPQSEKNNHLLVPI